MTIQMAQTAPSPMMSLQEVAEYLQVSPDTVKNLMERGLPGIRVGRQFRFRREEVEQWLEENRVNGNSAR